MSAVFFYHLSERPLEATLPSLLQKSLAAGWRVAVRSGQEDMVERLDQALWMGEGFLPHGKAGGAHDRDQPILLTTGAAENAARCVMLVGKAELSIDEAKTAERVCVLFDGGDVEAVEHARSQWREVTQAGLSAQYWADEGGRWTKKAENTPES